MRTIVLFFLLTALPAFAPTTPNPPPTPLAPPTPTASPTVTAPMPAFSAEAGVAAAGNNPLANLQATDVGNTLFGLQGCVEQALPVIASLTSGNTQSTTAGFSSPAGTSPFLPPTGVANPTATATDNAAPPQTFALTIGTNTVNVDPQTFQMIVVLQNDLQQALPILRALNGAGGGGGGFTNVNPGVFSNGFPILNGTFGSPLTNQSRLLGTPPGLGTPQ